RSIIYPGATPALSELDRLGHGYLHGVLVFSIDPPYADSHGAVVEEILCYQDSLTVLHYRPVFGARVAVEELVACPILRREVGFLPEHHDVHLPDLIERAVPHELVLSELLYRPHEILLVLFGEALDVVFNAVYALKLYEELRAHPFDAAFESFNQE